MKTTKRGRPRMLIRGRAFSVYMTDETIRLLRQLGGGNVSKGVAIAAKQAAGNASAMMTDLIRTKKGENDGKH